MYSRCGTVIVHRLAYLVLMALLRGLGRKKVSTLVAGLPGPRPPGAPLANGSAAAGGAHSGPLPYHQQQPVAAPGPGVLGPGLRPPGSYMSAGGPPSGGATTAAVPGSGPGSGGAVRPAMPGFMPAGPPGMPRPVGPGSMGGPAGDTAQQSGFLAGVCV